MVMKTAESKEKFDRNWELWCPAIINYVLATKNKSTALKCALRDMDMDLEGIIICIVYVILLHLWLFAYSYAEEGVNHCLSLPWTLSAY